MDQLEEIKSRVDIVQFISELVPLKKAGRNFKGLCPFHSEKTSSFVVSPERQIWHCFGACQTGGDIFGFLMRRENMEFPEALRTLAKRAGVTLKSYQSTEKTAQKELIYELNHLAGEFYSYILLSHKVGETARKYLEKRKVSKASIKLFNLGYAPDSWDSLIQFMQKKGYKLPDLATAGLVTVSEKNHYFDRFRGRVMFTLYDHRGNAVGFAGRLLDPDAKEAKYVNTAETPVYIKGNILYGLNTTKEEIKKENSAIVVEGEIDAIQSYQTGVRNVVAIKGSALTEMQVNLLKRYSENVILSLDTDLAGDAAAHRGIQIADKAGLNIKVATFDGAKDPDELIKKDPGLWRKAIGKAAPFYDYVIDNAAQKYDPKTADGKKRIVLEVAKFLAPIENAIVKTHYLKKLAKLVEVQQTDVEKEVDKQARREGLGAQIKEPEVAPPVAGETRRSKLERYLLAILFQTEDRPRLGGVKFSNIALAKIYKKFQAAKNISTADFIKALPTELQPLADELYLYELGEEHESMEKITKELTELTIREKMEELSRKINKAKDSEEEDKLTQELNRLIQRVDF